MEYFQKIRRRHVNWSYAFSGAVNYLPTCVTEADYIINLANLKGHSYGITLCGKTVLYLLDALICATSEGASITGDSSRWQQETIGGNYTSSVFLSQDPVAIDSVGADFLINEPAVTERNGALKDNPNVENYLHEAGLVGDAPSGNRYQDGNGETVTNLGVHEHWNNSVEKLYGRNLGGAEGIELISIMRHR